MKKNKRENTDRQAIMLCDNKYPTFIIKTMDSINILSSFLIHKRWATGFAWKLGKLRFFRALGQLSVRNQSLMGDMVSLWMSDFKWHLELSGTSHSAYTNLYLFLE